MQYDKNRFKIYALPHPSVLFWVLNPVLIINELILGQRIPKVTLIDKKSDKPLLERSYTPCPHCETLNDNWLWAKAGAFGNWFGYVCPSCHQIIPCLWNIFSLVILAITFPLWYLPVRFFRQRWLEKEKRRLADVLERPLIQAKNINWLLIGAFYSGFMWLTFPLVQKLLVGREWDLRMMFVVELPIWLVAGFVYGLWMRFSMNSKTDVGRRRKGLRSLWMHHWMNSKGKKE